MVMAPKPVSQGDSGTISHVVMIITEASECDIRHGCNSPKPSRTVVYYLVLFLIYIFELGSWYYIENVKLNNRK